MDWWLAHLFFNVFLTKRNALAISGLTERKILDFFNYRNCRRYIWMVLPNPK